LLTVARIDQGEDVVGEFGHRIRVPETAHRRHLESDGPRSLPRSRISVNAFAPRLPAGRVPEGIRWQW
jgi:hypothetical protein